MLKKETVRIILGIITCLLIAASDIAAAILGVKAEDAQTHAKHVRIIFFECKKRSYTAYVYGMYAAGFVIGAHVLANLLGFCISSSNSNLSLRKIVGIGCLFGAWVVFIPAAGALVLGAKSNETSKIKCGITHHNFLYYGGLACILHGVLSLSFFANFGSVGF